MNLLDQIEIDIGTPENLLTVYVDIWDLSLSRKWLASLNHLIKNNYHLEKNYCFFVHSGRKSTIFSVKYTENFINQNMLPFTHSTKQIAWIYGTCVIVHI